VPPYDLCQLIEVIDLQGSLAVPLHRFLRPWGALNPVIRDSLLQVSPEKAELYYTSPFVYDALIQAWIWRLVKEHLFCNPDRWEGPLWKGFGALLSLFSRRAGTIDQAVTCTHRSSTSQHSTLTPEQQVLEHAIQRINREAVNLEQQYHYWRVFTLKMIGHHLSSRSNEILHTSVERLTGVLMSKLTEVIDETKYSPQESEECVRILCDAAARFDISSLQWWDNIMMAWHLPCRTDSSMVGFPYTRSGALRQFVNGSGQEGDPIDFVISPGIFSSGDGYGIRYDEGSWIKAIHVAVNEFPDGVGVYLDEDLDEDLDENLDEDESRGITTKTYQRDASGRLVSVHVPASPGNGSSP